MCTTKIDEAKVIETIECLKQNKPTSDIKESSEELCEACSIAIELLYKQIPDKPLLMKEFNNSIMMPHCHSCLTLLDGNLNYCPNCGQRIDWKTDN